MKSREGQKGNGIMILWTLLPFAKAKFNPFAHHSSPETEAISEFKLYTNYPNPFRTITIIYFALMHTSRVKIDILDRAGKKILTLTDEILEAGIQRVPLYRVMNEVSLESGDYEYQMTVSNENGRFKQRKSFTLL